MAKPQPNNQAPLFAGCGYIVGQGHKGKHAFAIFCNKLTAEGDQFCPLHRLLTDDEGKEPARRRAAPKAKREYQQAEAEALALSPLRAENPDFDDVISNTGYQPNPARGK